MRPREREQDPQLPESSPTPSAPPPRLSSNISSMVVRPSETSAGDFEASELNHRINSATPRRESPIDLRRRRGGSPPPSFRRRGESPVGFYRRDSSPGFRRRGGGRGGGSPPPFRNPRSHRFQDNSQGYLPPAGSISPPLRRPRLDGSHYDTNFDYPAGSRFGRGFRGGGRGGGRFRDVSPPNGFGRGGRSSYGRGYTVDQRVLSPDGEYVHRNDPNLSPREGDWICGNPRCGNLNFARRTYCNNCDEPRYATTGRPAPIRSPVRTGPIRSPLRTGPIRSPHRPYFTSPPSRRSPPDTTAPPLDRALRRNFNGYQSPPRGRYRDDRIEYEEEYRGGGRNNWLMDEEWERRRGYDRRPLSPLPPRDRWLRERSRSPPMLKSSYMGRGRDDRRYNGRVNEFEMGGRGRVFRRGDDDLFGGRGRGDRRVLGRGRSSGDMY